MLTFEVCSNMRQPWGMEGMHPHKIYGGDGYITIPQYEWLTGHNRLT